jgi:cyclopropane-fatty-acyl-phospholipid synthase
MKLMSLEHGRLAYWGDFVVHGAALGWLTWHLCLYTAAWTLVLAVPLVVLGGAAWTLTEYLLHRCVLHGMPPFKRWHALHHARPQALIAGPTVLSSALLLLVAWPLWWALPLWAAQAWMAGFLAGYLLYGLLHHTLHQALHAAWPTDRGLRGWLHRRRRWHALHHHGQGARCYGVTTGFWDRRLGSSALGSPVRPC